LNALFGSGNTLTTFSSTSQNSNNLNNNVNRNININTNTNVNSGANRNFDIDSLTTNTLGGFGALDFNGKSTITDLNSYFNNLNTATTDKTNNVITKTIKTNLNDILSDFSAPDVISANFTQ